MAKFVLYKNEGKIYRLEAELPPLLMLILFLNLIPKTKKT